MRPAQPGDVQAIVRMRRALIAHLRECNPAIMLPSPEAEASYAQRYSERIGAEWCLFLVAESSRSGLVGMGEIHLVDNPGLTPPQTAKINDVWVDPAHRRRGIARAMAETLLVFAQSRGIDTVWLDWVAGNNAAEALWRDLGFIPALVQAVRRHSGALPAGNVRGQEQRAGAEGIPDP